MYKLEGQGVCCKGCGADFATKEHWQSHKTAGGQCIKPEAVGLVLQRIGADGDLHYVKPLPERGSE